MRFPRVKAEGQSGYAEALAKGSSLARQGIRVVLGHSDAICWKEVSQQYRKYLFVHGSLPLTWPSLKRR